MAFREFEVELDGGLFFEVEASITVRDGEVLSIDIEGARAVPEEGEPIEVVTMVPEMRATLRAEIERQIDDRETLQELEQADIDAARDDAEQAKIDQWKEERER